MQNSLVVTAGRAVAVTGKSAAKTIAARNAFAAAEFDSQVVTAAEGTFKDLLNVVSGKEVAIDNHGFQGLQLHFGSGLALAALKVKNGSRTCPANKKGDAKKEWTAANNWEAYCKKQKELDPHFPSYQQADKRIRLASMAASIPESDEMGNPWTMRSFERWATSGTSLNDLQLAKYVKATKAARRALPKGSTDSPVVTPDAIRAVKLSELEKAKAAPTLPQLEVIDGVAKCRSILMDQCIFPNGSVTAIEFSDDALAALDGFISSLTATRKIITSGKPKATRTRAKSSK